MISTIKKVLEKKNVEYLIQQSVSTSYELFFVFKELQMNRAKDVTHYGVTVYVEHDNFKGSSSIELSPSMSEEEIEQKIDNAIYAAGFVNNPKFELAKPEEYKESKINSNLDNCDKIAMACKIADCIFDASEKHEGFINATEIFINENKVRILNSNGIDYTKHSNDAKVEYITTVAGEKEEVELYSYLELGNVDLEEIKKDVQLKLASAKDRSLALPTPSIDKIDVVFRPLEIVELINYYLMQANVQMIYGKQSNCKVGDVYQEAKYDKLNITIDPHIPSSIMSSSFDSDGFINNKTVIYKDGRVENLWGSNIYGQYLNVKTSVNSPNMTVECGNLDLNTKDKYLEIVSMSGIQVDEQTGSFGGEIRLALLHEGGKVTSFSGGSISGFLKDYINEVELSKEYIETNNYNGPKFLMIKNATILGK